MVISKVNINEVLNFVTDVTNDIQRVKFHANRNMIGLARLGTQLYGCNDCDVAVVVDSGEIDAHADFTVVITMEQGDNFMSFKNKVYPRNIGEYQKFFQRLKEHDWYYEMSDDSNVYRFGKEMQEKLTAEAANDFIKSNMLIAGNTNKSMHGIDFDSFF